MSLLMDALKKADEAVDIPPSTNQDEDSKTQWNEELLPQFNTDSQLDKTPEKISEQDTDKWDDDFLPQFKEEPDEIQNNDVENTDIENTANSVIAPANNLIEDTNNIEVNELIEPPSQTEIKLPDTEKLQNIDEIQTLFSLTDKEHNDSNTVADLQIPTINIDEQSPLEEPIPEFSQKEYKPEDAQKFFTASNPPSPSKRTPWLLVVLVFIVVGMGAGYYYLDSSLNQSSSIKFGNSSQKPKFNPIPVKNDNEKTIIKPVVNVQPISPPKIKPIIKPAPIRKVTKAQTKKPEVQISPIKPTKIHTIRKTTTVNKDLSKAYTALQTGNDKTAKRTYQKVLRQDKNNRDAMLGLAALAIQNNNIPQAQQYYQRILRNYPKNIHAQVGLINSFGNAPKNETQLKLLLRQTPKAAYIHFSLGNLYANQGRWELAQQAYFDAMRYDKKHAGYVYNLAISLDQINQPKTALRYYQRALELANKSTANFNHKMVQKRINTLMKSLK